MKSFNLSKRIQSLVVLTILLASSGYSYSGEPNIQNRFINQPSPISESTYPEIALENNVEGRVIVQFQLLNGVANNIVVVKSIDSVLDKAAIEIVTNFSADYLKELENTGRTTFQVPVTFDII